MKKFKDIFIGILIGCILMTSCPVLADSIMQKIDVVLNSVNVQINGEKLETSTILYDGTTYLPMRKIAEAVGKDVDWNQETMTANIVAKTVTGSAIKPVDNIKVGDNVENIDNSNDFKVYQKDGYIFGESNNELYYEAMYVQELMSSFGKYYIDKEAFEKYKVVKICNTENGTLLDNVQYSYVYSRVFISKNYYENTILPLIIK
ncbi:MAG: stalk domain-containing protein [Burkholderiales bacterium]|nr:stalk domain-containing protein [Burkholderiales bacterium]